MNAIAHMTSALLITYTLFPDVTPVTKTERADVPWEELVDKIRQAPTYINKGACPLISLGEYGETRTDKDCLRHAANVQRIFGIEVDYDGEQMPIEEAAALLQRAGVCSVLYTSPSHTTEKPRWRALLPLSEPALPDKRREYVGRANRILGGIASRESFTLSQSFYLGRVRGADYIVIDTQGRYIDGAFDLEPLFHVSQTRQQDRPRCHDRRAAARVLRQGSRAVRGHAQALGTLGSSRNGGRRHRSEPVGAARCRQPQSRRHRPAHPGETAGRQRGAQVRRQ